MNLIIFVFGATDHDSYMIIDLNALSTETPQGYLLHIQVHHSE